jgi:hypothetical protein
VRENAYTIEGDDDDLISVWMPTEWFCDSDHNDNLLSSSFTLLFIFRWNLGEFNVWEKFTNYEVGTRTPLIFNVPPSVLDSFRNSSSTNEARVVNSFPPSNLNDDKTFLVNSAAAAAVAETAKLTTTMQRQRQTQESPMAVVGIRSCVNELVELVDIFPTLTELAGLPLPDSNNANDSNDDVNDSNDDAGNNDDNNEGGHGLYGTTMKLGAVPPLQGKSLVPLFFEENGQGAETSVSDRGSDIRHRGSGGGGVQQVVDQESEEDDGDDVDDELLFDMDFEVSRVALSQFPR